MVSSSDVFSVRIYSAMELNLIFIFLLLATRAYAGPGEDNINNLFSDLGP